MATPSAEPLPPGPYTGTVYDRYTDDVDAEPYAALQPPPPAPVVYQGRTWWRVGLRDKGRSSLRFGYEEGVGKLPFRLDFDQFEDDNPDLADQRFWGFKKMTFANSHEASLSRMKLLSS